MQNIFRKFDAILSSDFTRGRDINWEAIARQNGCRTEPGDEDLYKLAYEFLGPYTRNHSIKNCFYCENPSHPIASNATILIHESRIDRWPGIFADGLKILSLRDPGMLGEGIYFGNHICDSNSNYGGDSEVFGIFSVSLRKGIRLDDEEDKNDLLNGNVPTEITAAFIRQLGLDPDDDEDEIMEALTDSYSYDSGQINSDFMKKIGYNYTYAGDFYGYPDYYEYCVFEPKDCQLRAFAVMDVSY